MRKIVLDELGGSEGLSEQEIRENMRLEFSRATAFDKNIKKYSCDAKLITGGTYQLPITYESQLDDKNQHIVSVGGIGRGDLLVLQAGLIEGIKRYREEKGVTAKPTEVPSKAIEKPSVAVASVALPSSVPVTAPLAEKAEASPKTTWLPSFDCTKASNFSEKAICSDTLLGKLDGALSENYRFILASNIGDGAKKDLKTAQKKWILERDKCPDNQCLTTAYQKRIDEVCEYPVITGIHPICTNASDIK